MKRPAAITVLCVILGALWSLNWVSIVISFSEFGIGRMTWIIATQVGAGISIAGIWLLKVWGPALYFGGQIAGIVAFFSVPPAGAELYPIWMIFVIPMIVAIPIALNWKAYLPEGGSKHA